MTDTDEAEAQTSDLSIAGQSTMPQDSLIIIQLAVCKKSLRGVDLEFLITRPQST